MKTLGHLVANIFVAALAAALVAGFNVGAENATPVSFERLTGLTGAGCPQGSIVVTGESTANLSLAFNAYDAGDNAVSGAGPRASCEFVVPIKVAAGYQVSALTVEWQGSSLGKTTLKREYSFEGNPEASLLTSDFLNTNANEVHLKRDSFPEDKLLWTDCGSSLALQVNSGLHAKDEGSYIVIDTASLNHHVVFQVQARPC